MKTKLFSVLSLSVLFLVMFMGAVSAVTIAEWDFEASSLVPSTDITSGATLNISDSRTAAYFTGIAPSAATAMSTTGWDIANRYIELDLSTSGLSFLKTISDTS